MAPQVSAKQTYGFVALINVLLLGAIGTLFVTSFLLLGVDFSRTGAALVRSTQAKALANACAEEALQKLRESVYYAGSEQLAFTTGSCTIEPIQGVGNLNRTVQVTAAVTNVKRKIKIVVAAIHPTIQITSWQEVADF